MASTLSRRRRRLITLDQKLKIIKELKSGKLQRLVTTLHSVPKSMVGDIWSDHDKIENFVSMNNCPSVAKKRCIVRKAKFEELE